MITWSGNHVTLWVSFPHHKSPPCQVWWSETLQQKGCFVFNLSCELMWKRDQRVMRHYRWAILIISHHSAKFGCHRRSAREDISFLVCHVTLRYYMVRELRDVKREFPLSQLTTVQSSVIKDLLEEEILSFYHVTWRGDAVRGSCDITNEFPSS